MNNLIKLIAAAAFISTATISVSALADEPKQPLQNALKGVEEMKKLPISGMVMIKSAGKYYFASENGRFLFRDGKLLDMWNGAAEISTIADANSLDKISLEKLGIKLSDLPVYTYGTGKKEFTAFIDPYCGYCHQLLDQLKSVSSEYRVNLILLPLLGQKSGETAKSITCMKDQEAALNAVVSHEYSAIPVADKTCDTAKLQKSIILARLLGIEGVPFMILPDGTVNRGGTNNLTALLKKGSK